MTPKQTPGVKVADNALKFLHKAAALHGKQMEARFGQEMYMNCIGGMGMTSPIEHMFWVACAALCEAEFIPLNPGPEFNSNGGLGLGYGAHIKPQHQIGSYRVDFLLSQNNIGPDSILTPVIVELDGHAFHDKDQKQRAYEKARDRFFIKEGYRVLHFTGSEVVADPFKVAFEALTLIGLFSGSYREEYNAENPLGEELP